jgi:hypothetical protein
MAMQINKDSGYKDKEIRNKRGSRNLSYDSWVPQVVQVITKEEPVFRSL